MNNLGTSPPAFVSRAENLFCKQKERVNLLVSQFKSSRRKNAALRCVGNSNGAKKRFWSYISNKKNKSSEISALINPVSGCLTCDPAKVKDIVETHLLKLFKAGYSPPPSNIDIVEPVQEDLHQVTENQVSEHGYCLPKAPSQINVRAPPPNSLHTYAEAPTPVLIGSDNSARSETDPVGYCDKEVSQIEVQAIIKLLSCGKAAGWDRIPNEALIHSGPDFLKQLTILFN
jgi:hypothetical protein